MRGGNSPVLCCSGKRKLDPPIILPPLFYIYCMYIYNAPPFSIFTPHCTFPMCIRAIYNICLNNPYAPAGDLGTVPAVSDVTAVRGVLAKAGVLIRTGNIASRMLIEKLKTIQERLLLSAFKNTDQNTELNVFD